MCIWLAYILLLHMSTWPSICLIGYSKFWFSGSGYTTPCDMCKKPIKPRQARQFEEMIVCQEDYDTMTKDVRFTKNTYSYIFSFPFLQVREIKSCDVCKETIDGKSQSLAGKTLCDTHYQVIDLKRYSCYLCQNLRIRQSTAIK